MGRTPDLVTSQQVFAWAYGVGLSGKQPSSVTIGARRLPPAGVHIFRHSAAKLRRDAGESVEDVSRFLDHGSLATTTTYLRRLEGEEDRSWAKVAEAIGV